MILAFHSAKSAALKTLLITLAVSVPFAVALYVFAPLAQRIIFRSLTQAQAALLIKLVRIMSVNAVTLSVMQTASACLTALGTPLKATVTQWITCFMRVALTAVLIKYATLSVEGAAIAANVSYFVAAALNLWYIMRAGGAYENNAYRARRAGRRSQRQG